MPIESPAAIGSWASYTLTPFSAGVSASERPTSCAGPLAPPGCRSTTNRTGTVAAPARMRQRVTTPAAGAMVARPGIGPVE
jgi:hypothetical protein